MKIFHAAFCAACLLSVTPVLAQTGADALKSTDKHPVVIIKTNFGPIILRLDGERAPVTVKNFLSYAGEGFYDSTLFHRVIKNFMIQGGGFTVRFSQKPTKLPIENEAANGLQNKRGTIAMARTNDINSATSQFFINVVDNTQLDHKDMTPRGYGYAVFGEVIMGMEVADAIAATPTGTQDVPASPVIIETIMVNK